MLVPRNFDLFYSGDPGFLPSDLNGLGLWLDAAIEVTKDSSSPPLVSQWDDQSGNSRDLSNTSNEPWWYPTSQNTVDPNIGYTYPICMFRSADHVFTDDSDILQNVTGWSYFQAGQRWNGSAGTASAKHFLISTNGSETNPRFGLSSDSSDNYILSARRLDADSTDTLTEASTSLDYFGHLLEARVNLPETYAEMLINGTSIAADTSFLTAGNTSNTTSDKLTIGGTSANDIFFEGSEFILYPRYLIDIEREQVWLYLGTKYNEQTPYHINQYFAFIGDSITAAASGGGTTWPEQLSVLLGDTLRRKYDNDAVSGYTIGLDSYTGTVATTATSTTVTGTGTTWDTAGSQKLVAGAIVNITDGDQGVIVDSVTSDTEFEATEALDSTVAGKAWERVSMETVMAAGLDANNFTVTSPNGKVILCALAGSNNLGSGWGQTAAVAYAELRNFIQQRTASGKYDAILCATVIPRTGAGVNTRISTFNSLMVDNFVTELSVDGVTALVRLDQVAGVFDDYTDDAGSEDNLTYYTSDETHTNDAGRAQIAATFRTAIEALDTATYYGAPAFYPKDVEGLIVWLDMESGITMNGGDISNITDISNSGNDATQGTASAQPVYTTNSINSLPTATFDGTAHKMSIAYDAADMANMTNEFSVYAAINANNPQPIAFTQFLSNYNSFSGDWLINQNDDTGNWRLYLTPAGQSQQAVTLNGTPFDGSNHVISVRVSSGTVKSSVDGGATDTDSYTHGSTGFNATTSIVIGHVTSTRYWSGDLGCLMIFNRSLTDAEDTSVVTYLKTRYGVS